MENPNHTEAFTTAEEKTALLQEEIAQLKASDRQLRLLTDFSPALISYVDREERYRFMNRRYTEWFGFDSKKAIGKTILEVVGPVAYEKAKIQIRDALKGKHIHFENHVVMKNGDTKFVDLQFVPFENSGKINGFVILGYDITDRKKSELALKEVQTRLEFALESAKMSSWYLDLKTNQVSSNPGSSPFSGYEVKRQSLYDMTCARVHPDDVDDTFKALGDSIRDHKPYHHEYRQIQSDGTYRWILSRAMPQYDADGSPISISGLMVDITERKQTEDLYRAMTELSPQFVWISNAQGAITYSNKTLLKYMGVDQHQTFGDSWLQALHPDDRERTIEVWKKAISTGEPYEVEFRVRSENGSYGWFLNRATPMRDSRGGRIDRWLGVSTDITEQRQIRDNLSFLAETSAILSSSLDYNETLQRLAKVAVPNLANWCSISVIEEGEIPKAIAIAHPDPEMMKIGEEFRMKYPPDWNSNTGAAKVLKTGKSEIYSWVTDDMIAAAAKDPEHLRLLQALKIRSIMIVPIQGRTQPLGILTLVSNTVDRRYTETDLAIAEEIGKRAGLAIENARLFTQAQGAVRMRDEFFSIASHELKTPITSLKLQIQMNQRRFQKEPHIFADKKIAEKLLNTSSTQVDRLSKLVDEMLDISRIRHGKMVLEPTEVDLGFLVRDVVDRFHEQFASAGCRYRLNIESQVIGHWDRYRIEQVVTNLITNAIKYGARKPVDISMLTEATSAVIYVKDHGIGIARESLDKIFDRFERAVTEKSISGLGLGLYISRQIVEAHNGNIRVLSELGEGSTFTVELPLAR